MTTKVAGLGALTMALLAGAAPVAAQGVPPIDPARFESALRERDRAIARLRSRLNAVEKRLADAEEAAKRTPPPEGATIVTGTTPPPPLPPSPPVPPAGAPSAPTTTAAGPGTAGPGQVVVDPLAAERALERALVQTGALLLQPGEAEAEISLTYQRSDRESPSFVLGAGGAITGLANQKLTRDRITAKLEGRVGLPYQSQVEVGLPINYIDQSLDTIQAFNAIGSRRDHGYGLGDLELGIAKTLWREQGWTPDVVGRIVWDTNTGEKSDNDVALPAGFNEVRGELVAIKRNDPLVFVISGNYQYAFEENHVQPGQQYGFSLGTILGTSPTTSLRASFDTVFGEEAERRGGEIKGSDFTSASLNLGASIVLAPRILLDLQGAVGITEDAPDFTLRVAVPIRFDTPFR